MRNGNKKQKKYSEVKIFQTVLILPMRNGNGFKSCITNTTPRVLILPMRNGNHQTSSNYILVSVLFLSYLWGMETYVEKRELYWGLVVLILPMRNGNHISWINYWFVEPVLILPMRNGNGSSMTYSEPMSLTFLSYLWGMETKIVNIFFANFHMFLSYLWGMETLVLQAYQLGVNLVLILPMRNGNSLTTT